MKENANAPRAVLNLINSSNIIIKKCSFQQSISKHVSNPVYVITQNLRKNKCTQSYGNEASITCNINHNFYSGSDTIPIRPILQTTKLTVSIASKTIP